MDSVKKAKYAYIIYSTVLIVLGLVFLVIPKISVLTIWYLIGSVTLICGIIKFFSYFVNDTYGLAFQFDFSLGIFAMLIGILLLLHPKSILAFINIIFGVFILIDGVFKMQTSKEAKHFGIHKWYVIFIFSILTTIAGIFLIVDPLKGAITITTILALSLIIDGLQNLYVAISTIKLVKRFSPINYNSNNNAE